MKKVTLIGLLAVAALSVAAVGLAVSQDAPREAVAGAALGQDKDGQCEHQPGSAACEEAHAKGQCDHGPGPCDPAKCDPEKCGGKCGRHGDRCDPAKCDPAKCGDASAGCLVRLGLLAQLNLTTEQQQAMTAARERTRQQVNELRQQLTAEREKLVDLWSVPEPDEAAIVAQRDKVAALRHQVQERVAAHLLEVKGLLTPDQQTEFDEIIRRCPPGGHGDGCDPAKCDPAKCGGHADGKGRAGCSGRTRAGCAGHAAGGGE
jgi:Spy/CpxP family protein refolding chaperone